MPAAVHRVPAFADNYIWLFEYAPGTVAVVDPGDAAPVLEAVAARGLVVSHILNTHWHADHTGGIPALRDACAPALICGPANPAIAGITQPLREGDAIEVLGQRFDVLEVPGHTLDHIAYVGAGLTPPALFCGDTLFAAGCGRLFEGTPAQMHASLGKLAALPENTAVFCTHEYTQANLRFAQAVEPDNLALRQRTQAAAQTRANHQPTLPSTLALELATNPFLRTQSPAVRQAALRHAPQSHNDVEIFAAIRAWKDQC